jgi:tetratricopeptide (TPR) repeat protein
MRPTSQAPSLARLSAVFIGLVLSASVSFANAQTLPDIQRLMKQNQLPQALEKVDIYISSKPKDAQGRFLKGLILTDMARTTDAIAILTRLTEDFPELPEPYNNLAVLYAQQKQYDKARTALEMAIRTHPSYSIAHENLGDVYAKLASQAYDKALQLDSSNTVMQTKLSMIKELISTSTKPDTKPLPVATRPAAEPVKTAAAEPPKSPNPPKLAVSTPQPSPQPAPQPPAAAPVKPVEKVTTAPITTTPKQPEARPAPEDKALEPKVVPEKAPAENNESEIAKATQDWADAWSRKDVKGYLGYYANDFQTPRGMTRKAWETERSKRIDKPGKLQVAVSDIKVSVNGDKATARFRQQYTSSTFNGRTSKTMVFVKAGNRWLIQQESVD